MPPDFSKNANTEVIWKFSMNRHFVGSFFIIAFILLGVAFVVNY